MAKTFTRRIYRPADTNKYYVKTTYRGYNKCALVNPLNGSVLPNCVGYSWGRFCECQGIHTCKLSTGDAGNWYYKRDGYKRGRTPKLGAVICWSDSQGAGHVANVEKVYANGNILTSNSAWNGSYFWTDTLKANNNYYFGKTYTFQGFIYPDTEFIDPDTPVPPEPQKIFKSKFPWVLYARKFRKRHFTKN